MKVIPFVYEIKDELLSNTYICIEDNNCIVIDPSSDYDGIINYINKNNLHLLAILVTHAHFDHIGGVDRLVNTFNVKVYAHREELESFTDTYLNVCDFASTKKIVVNSEITPVEDNEILHLLKEDIICIHTPYHTKGSTSYYFKDSKALFSGDSLFMYGFGRTDLPTSCPRELNKSIEKLMKLDDEVKVYPGHGRFTTIGNERNFIYRHNHF